MRAATVNGDQTLSETQVISYLPMNKIPEYIDDMPLSDTEKAALPTADFASLHRALDDEHKARPREDDSPLGSVKARWSRRGRIHWRKASWSKTTKGVPSLRRCRKLRAPQCSPIRGAPTR